jgi:hypothetical protein
LGRTFALTLATTLALYAIPTAQACDGVYDTGALIDDLTVVEDSLRSGDAAAAGGTADKMEANLACLEEPIPYAIVGRIYRGIGTGKWMSGNEERGRQWFLTALETDPTFEYGTEDMPMDSPIRLMYLDLRVEADANPESMDASFQEGRIFLDGGLTGSVSATLGRPHLVQRDLAGAISGWVIEGNAFPADLLGDVVAAAAPVEADPRDSRRIQKEAERAARDAARLAERQGVSAPPISGVTIVRAPEKTPLIIGGAVAVAAAGGLYYASTITRGQFDEAKTEDDARKARQSTNNLVIASAVVGATGVSALTWGIIVDQGPGFRIGGRF